MKYKRIGTDGPVISCLTLGTMMFGKTVDERSAKRIVDIATDRGITSIDTAGTYNFGESEIITGKAIAGNRSKIVLGSKVGYPLSGGIDTVNLSAEAVTGETEKALKRLGTDYLDILYLHAPDAKTPVYETLEAADRLVKSGKVLYIGISNYSAWQLAEMMCISGSEQLTPICVTQNIYNVLSRKIEAELVPCARHCGSGIMVYNPLAGGLLTGKYTGMNAGGGRLAWNDMYRRRFLNEANLAAVSTLKAAAEARGISLIELAYRWCTSRDFIDSVLVGVSSAEQLESNLSLCGFEPLDEELEACCEEQWKKVCGIAPDYSR